MIALIIFCTTVPLSGEEHRANQKVNESKSQLRGFCTAVTVYHDEYGKWPDALGIFAALEGNNYRGIIFYDPDKKHMLPNGVPLDPWGQSYIFDGIVDDRPRFHSIGKDGMDQHGAEGSDDIVSWR